MCDDYTEIDFIQKNYDIACHNYELLIDDIDDLWKNVMLDYLENNVDNGILEGLSNNGYSKFIKFIMSKSKVAQNVILNLKKAKGKLDDYIRENCISNIELSVYYKDKCYNLLDTIDESYSIMEGDTYQENYEE